MNPLLNSFLSTYLPTKARHVKEPQTSPPAKKPPLFSKTRRAIPTNPNL